MDPIIQRLISSGKCTLVELKEKLSLEDAYLILEAEYVAAKNENIAHKRAMEKAERKDVRSAY